MLDKDDSDSLETYFENQNEMKKYCSLIAGKKCIKPKIRNNGNYYKIFCNEEDCPFKIVYNQRNSQKIKQGFYLYSNGTCLEHKADCPNLISNINDTKNPRAVANQILPLFQGRFPSLNEIKNAIQCFNKNEFTKTELKYIKKLIKMIFFFFRIL